MRTLLGWLLFSAITLTSFGAEAAGKTATGKHHRHKKAHHSQHHRAARAHTPAR